MSIQYKRKQIKKLLEILLHKSLETFIRESLWKEPVETCIRIIYNSFTKEDELYCKDKTEHLIHIRDHRTPIQFVQNLILIWIVEDCIQIAIEDCGYFITSYGGDRKREILSDRNEITNKPDLLIEKRDNNFKKVEVVTAFNDRFRREKKIGFRDKKLPILYQEKANILALDLHSFHFIYIPLSKDLDVEYEEEGEFGKKTYYLILPETQNFYDIENLRVFFKYYPNPFPKRNQRQIGYRIPKKEIQMKLENYFREV